MLSKCPVLCSFMDQMSIKLQTCWEWWSVLNGSIFRSLWQLCDWYTHGPKTTSSNWNALLWLQMTSMCSVLLLNKKKKKRKEIGMPSTLASGDQTSQFTRDSLGLPACKPPACKNHWCGLLKPVYPGESRLWVLCSVSWWISILFKVSIHNVISRHFTHEKVHPPAQFYFFQLIFPIFQCRKDTVHNMCSSILFIEFSIVHVWHYFLFAQVIDKSFSGSMSAAMLRRNKSDCLLQQGWAII